MRIARSNVFARILLGAALVLVFVYAPRAVYATAEFDDKFTCNPMKPKLQAGYRALETGHYADAEEAFTESANEYALCSIAAKGTGFPLMGVWQGYAEAGIAAARFGAGKIVPGLESVGRARGIFNELFNGTRPGATESQRRLANDGLAYVGSLESAKKPLLPKVWLDWKAAHP